MYVLRTNHREWRIKAPDEAVIKHGRTIRARGPSGPVTVHEIKEVDEANMVGHHIYFFRAEVGLVDACDANHVEEWEEI